mgnify:CR=1 FL=1
MAGMAWHGMACYAMHTRVEAGVSRALTLCTEQVEYTRASAAGKDMALAIT